MVAEIISVGTELILGQVTDTNATFLARRLSELSVILHRRTVVGDEVEHIKSAIQEALRRSDWVILTGGLGPTPDDRTAEGIAAAFCVPTVRHPEAERWLLKRLRERGLPPSPTLFKQVHLPQGAEILPNPIGTAPGIWMERGGKLVVALPGVPEEMQAMFNREVLPRFQKRLPPPLVRVRVLRFTGVGESALTDRLGELMHRENPSFGTIVKAGEIWLRLVACAQTEAEAERLLDEAEEKVRDRTGQWLFGVGEEPLEALVGEALRERGWSIATAESVTGGMVCALLTDVPGASEYVRGAIVAYTEGAKMSLLSVPWQILEEAGAVSPECARMMARQVRTRFKAQVGVATTGYAGPTGGEPDKPIGTVFIAVTTPEKTVVRSHQIQGTRHQVRERAARLALIQTLQALRGEAG